MKKEFNPIVHIITFVQNNAISTSGGSAAPGEDGSANGATTRLESDGTAPGRINSGLAGVADQK